MLQFGVKFECGLSVESYAFVSKGTVSERSKFKSLSGQIEHGGVNDSPQLRHFLETSCVVRDYGRNDAEMGPANSLTCLGKFIHLV